jgi:hypothetical protein
MPTPEHPIIEDGPTYTIRANPVAVGGRTITCTRCQRTSFNRNDVAHRYCGACHIFRDDLARAQELRRRGNAP